MISKANEPIYRKSNGTYVVIHNGSTYWCGFPDDDTGTLYPHKEVEAYLLEHPEALIPEPVPPAPTQEELDAREVQTLTSYLASTGWYSERASEYVESNGLYGKPTPPEILTARQAARDRISELKA